MTNTQTEKVLEALVDKTDAEIMDWFYECVKINFNAEMVQDSTKLRSILLRALIQAREEGRKEGSHGDYGRKMYQKGREEVKREILEKLPKEEMELDGFDRYSLQAKGFNSCLSTVKTLIEGI